MSRVAMSCAATREAVEEMEERGEVGCPLCGRSAETHPQEASQTVEGLDYGDRCDVIRQCVLPDGHPKPHQWAKP